MDTQLASGIYVKRPAPQPLAGPLDHDTLRDIAAACADEGFALTPPRPPLCNGRAPRVLTAAAIAKSAPLRTIRDALPKRMKLIVVAWADGAGIITAVDRKAPEPPPAWWLEKAYLAAAKLPPPPADLPRQPWGVFNGPTKGGGRRV